MTDRLEEKYRDEEQFLLTHIAGLQYAAALVVPWAVLSSDSNNQQVSDNCNRTQWVFVMCQVLLSLFTSYFLGDRARRDQFLDEGAFGTEKDTVFGLWLLYCCIWSAVIFRTRSNPLRMYLLGFLAVQAVLLIWLFFY